MLHMLLVRLQRRVGRRRVQHAPQLQMLLLQQRRMLLLTLLQLLQLCLQLRRELHTCHQSARGTDSCSTHHQHRQRGSDRSAAS